MLVWHTDRLHRRNAELESWIGEIAEPYRVTGHSVQAGPIDLATPSGPMVAGQLGAVAHYESAIKAERLRSKMEQKADHGEWLLGPARLAPDRSREGPWAAGRRRPPRNAPEGRQVALLHAARKSG